MDSVILNLIQDLLKMILIFVRMTPREPSSWTWFRIFWRWFWFSSEWRLRI